MAENEREPDSGPATASSDAFGGMGRLDGGHNDFDSLLAEYEAAEPKASEGTEPQTGGKPVAEAPDAATWREGARRMGLSSERIEELLPEGLKTLEEVEAARQSLLAEVQYEDAVNQQFVEYIKEDMARVHAAREMSDLLDLRKELSEINPSFGAKSEAEQTQLLLGKARTDEKILDAWENRYSDRAGWQNAKDNLAAWTNTVSPYYDADITADRLAVADAVRGHSGHRPPRLEPALGQMSDDEFNRHLVDEYGIEH